MTLPHPDDEFEAASVYSHTPDVYKVFILMSRGESTYHCSPVGYQLSILDGATPPSPAPDGMETASCEQARLASWVKYFTAMSATDPTLPGDFEEPTTTSPFPTLGAALAREVRAAPASTIKGQSENGAPTAGHTFTDTTARVWIDRQGRGALVDFDLGDGDLTQAKVNWAVRTVLNNKSALGLNSTLPDSGVVGAYSNLSNKGCYVYTHPDHAAVDDALRASDFDLPFQSAATCGAEPNTTTTLTVPTDVLNAAYPADGSPGVFAASYGWLETPEISRTDQRSMFMGVQSFDISHEHVPISRVSGADRYSTSAEISRAAYPTTAPVVYIASGTDYPDALSGGAAAAKQNAPLLLTPAGGLPFEVAIEISRLHPSRAVIVGGVNAVSSQVAGQVAALVPDVVRLAGADRYDTSWRVAQYAFQGPLPAVYVASGSSFPDALSATSAAGSQGAPVILLPGSDRTGATVVAALRELAPHRVILVGGSSVIPSTVDAALARIAPVSRVAGADRFATNAAMTSFAFRSSQTALVASGLNFPDALGGAAWGGHLHVPLVLAQPGCLTKSAANGVYELGVKALILLGGTAVVSNQVGDGAIC